LYPKVPERVVVNFERLDLSEVFFANSAVGHLARGAIGDFAPLEPAPTPPRVEPLPIAKKEGSCILMQVATLDRGGVEQFIYDLTSGMQARGKRVVILVIESSGEIADRSIRAGVEVVVLGGYTPDAYEDAISKFEIEAAITHHSYEGLDQLHARGIPIIEVVHNYYHWQQSTPNDYLKKSESVRKRVAVSGGVADFHAEAFDLPRDDIEVIWNPINSQGFIRPERRLLERARSKWKKEFIFINVAQFFSAKAQASLISAFEQIHHRYPQTRLRLVGAFTDTDIRDQVLAQIKTAGIQNAVDLPGFVGRRTLSRFYATSHVFVQPSVYEGFSVAMAEAAHFALPMILTRIGGAADIIRHNDCGILIPPHFESLVGVRESEIFERGRNPMPTNLSALVDAMESMITEYDTWMSRGFIAQDRIDQITVDEAAVRYLSLVERLRAT
jgi:glycosyltransferase involved in cell wall biosynthesis